MKMKKLMSILLVVALITCMAACGGTASSATESQSEAVSSSISSSSSSSGSDAPLAGKTIIIGDIAPMTGALAAYGTAVDNSVRMAADEINAAGGILGATVEISTKDDQHTPDEAVSGFNALLSEGATAVIGAVASADTSAITGLANDEGVVLITGCSTADSITTEDDYVFRSCFKDSFQGEMVAAFAASKGWSKAAILYATGDAYSSGLRDAFVAAAADYGIEVVCEQSTSDTGAVDFSSQLATIAASGAECLFAPYYYDAVGPKIIPQAREAGFTGAILGADGFDGTCSYTTGDLAAYDNCFFTNHFSAEDPSEAVQSYVRNYSEQFGADSLNALGALCYDAMYMIKQAIESCGSMESSAIRDAMCGMHYVGVTGDMTLDETGTPAKSVSILTFVQENGALVQKFVTSQG